MLNSKAKARTLTRPPFLIFWLGLLLPGSGFAQPRIAIIGAGFAGLTAAYRLHEAGHTVDVYEARNRVGGRVYTIKINGSFEELGGRNLNDGGDAAHVVQLAHDLHVPLDVYSPPALPVLFDSKTGRAYDANRDLMPSLPPLTDQTENELKKLEKKAKNLAEVLDVYFAGKPLLRKFFENRMRNYEGAETQLLSPAYAHGSFLWMLKMSHNQLELSRKDQRRADRFGFLVPLL